MPNLEQKPHKVLVCGLPGSGKTTLARSLAEKMGAVHFNGDEVRHLFGDVDFSVAGRMRQAARMSCLADIVNRASVPCVCDFVCPTEAARSLFAPTLIVFMDRIRESRYADTNAIFERPTNPDFSITADLTVEQAINIIRYRYQ